jgi:hypothetical protein
MQYDARYVSNKSTILNLNMHLNIPSTASFKVCLFVARIENAPMDPNTSAIQADFNNGGQMMRTILKSRLPNIPIVEKNAMIDNIDSMTCSLIDSANYNDLVNFKLPWNMNEYTDPDAQYLSNPRIKTHRMVTSNEVCGSDMNSSYLKKEKVDVNGKDLTLTRVALCQLAEWTNSSGVFQTKMVPCSLFTFTFEDNQDRIKKCICIIDALCSALRRELLIFSMPSTGNIVVCFTKFGNRCDIGLSALTETVPYYMKQMRFRNWEEVKKEIIGEYTRKNEISIMDGLEDYLEKDTYIGKNMESSRMIRLDSNDQITIDKIYELNLSTSEKIVLDSYFKYGKDSQKKIEIIRDCIKFLTSIVIKLKIQQAISNRVILGNPVEPDKIQQLNLTEDEKNVLIEYFNSLQITDANKSAIITKLKLEQTFVHYILKQINLSIKAERLTHKFISKLKSEVELTKLFNLLNEKITSMSPSKYKTLKARTTWKRSISKVLTKNKTKRHHSPKTTWKRIIGNVISQNKTRRRSKGIRLSEISIHDK